MHTYDSARLDDAQITGHACTQCGSEFVPGSTLVPVGTADDRQVFAHESCANAEASGLGQYLASVVRGALNNLEVDMAATSLDDFDLDDALAGVDRVRAMLDDVIGRFAERQTVRGLQRVAEIRERTERMAAVST